LPGDLLSMFGGGRLNKLYKYPRESDWSYSYDSEEHGSSSLCRETARL